MKDKVFHESSQSDDNSKVLNRTSTSKVPRFNSPGGKCLALKFSVTF